MGVAVAAGDDFVGQTAGRALHFGVVKTPPHQPFDRKDGVFRVGNSLPLGGLPHIALAAAGIDGHHRGGDAVALGVFHHFRLASLNDGGHRVGSAEIDA